VLRPLGRENNWANCPLAALSRSWRLRPFCFSEVGAIDSESFRELTSVAQAVRRTAPTSGFPYAVSRVIRQDGGRSPPSLGMIGSDDYVGRPEADRRAGM